jgi:two-component system nitrogen regulation sensor histidine kinase GlnL
MKGNANITERIQQRVLENLTTSVLVLDTDLNIEYINPAGEMLFEISARKAKGMPLGTLISDPDHIVMRMQTCLLSGHPFTERELRLDLFGHRTKLVDCTVTPLDEPHEKNALLVEIVRVDRQLRISREENLIAQHHATRAVVRGLAHEIKNPLGGLRGAAQLLEHELPDEELKEYTRIIIEEADRLQNLVNRMLGPNTLPNKQGLNIHRVLERVRTLVLAEAPPGVQIARDYDPSIPMLEADIDQLIQAVLNLVRNAVQAVGEKGLITLRTRSLRHFTIGQVRHKLVLMVEIIDNGPGIPEDILEKIFYPMITGHANGTGLGLSIAQSLVNRHDGLIECTSEPGNTVFRILLPLERANDD